MEKIKHGCLKKQLMYSFKSKVDTAGRCLNVYSFFPFFFLIYVFLNSRHFGNRHFGTVDIMGIDFMGIDILGIDILALPRHRYAFLSTLTSPHVNRRRTFHFSNVRM